MTTELGYGLNLQHSLFKGFNDNEGIVVCGIEAGMSKDEQETIARGDQITSHSTYAVCTFSSKYLRYEGWPWPFDRRIIKWFDLWGHPITTKGPDEAPDFDRCIVNINWCNSQNPRAGKYWEKARFPCQVDNFILHVSRLRPKLILLLGVQLIWVLQAPEILSRFQSSSEGGMGNKISNVQILKKDFSGRRFQVGFQEFENGDVVALPHTASMGLSDGYIEKFKEEMDVRISKVKRGKGIAL